PRLFLWMNSPRIRLLTPFSVRDRNLYSNRLSRVDLIGTTETRSRSGPYRMPAPIHLPWRTNAVPTGSPMKYRNGIATAIWSFLPRFLPTETTGTITSWSSTNADTRHGHWNPSRF